MERNYEATSKVLLKEKEKKEPVVPRNSFVVVVISGIPPPENPFRTSKLPEPFEGITRAVLQKSLIFFFKPNEFPSGKTYSSFGFLVSKTFSWADDISILLFENSRTTLAYMIVKGAEGGELIIPNQNRLCLPIDIEKKKEYESLFN